MTATEHWITDLYTVHPTNPHYSVSHISTNHQAVFYLFHMLRVMGWKLIAECDDPTLTPHVTDGSMESSGVTSWSVVGTATRAKSTARYHDGSRSLTFTTAALGDGVQSANFVSVVAGGVAYRLSFWLWNNCGHALTCYIDNGNGSWVSLGTMPSDGTWTRYDFGYTTHSSVASVKFKIVDDAGTVAADQVYLDSAYTTISYYEQSRNGGGTDGVIEAGNNTFSSASYTFTSADVTNARKLVVYDPTNPGNSGVYTIVGSPGGKALVELRCVGTYYLTAATGLTFRVISPALGSYNTSGGAVFYSGSTGAGNGFCLESPHPSAWRFKVRHYWAYGGSTDGHSGNTRWASSPEDCDLDVETFRFFKTKRSTSRNMLPDTTYGLSPTDVHNSSAANDRYSGDGRFSALIADDGSYIFLLFRTTAGYHDAVFMGFLGDNYLADDDTYAHIQGVYGGTTGNWIVFSATVASWTYYGCTFGANSLGCYSSIGSLGWGTSTGLPEAATNAKANPYSGEEYIRPLFLFCDWPGAQGQFKIIEAQIDTLGHCRQNLSTFTPFGASLEWFHIINGLAMKWHGRQVIA